MESKISLILSKSRIPLYLAVCTGNFLALAGGIAVSWTSPVLPKLLEEQYLSSNPLERLISLEEASWIGSLLPLGGIIGPIVAGFITSRIGRKKGVLLCSVVPCLTAYLILAFAKRVFLYYIARFLAGFAISSIFTIIPLYNGEVAEDCIRGFICSSMTTFETGGELLGYCVGPYLTIYWFSIVSAAMTLVFALFYIIIVPESPYYLMETNNRAGAEKSLMKLRSAVTKDEVKSELEFMETVINESKANHGTIRDVLTSKPLRRAQLTMIGLTTFQHCSGIIPVLFYAQTIFEESGSSLPPEICSIAIGSVQFLASFITPNLVDKLGRRWLLFISSVGMGVAEVHLGFYFYWKSHGRDVSSYYWLPISCLVTFMVSYILGFGPLVWTIMGEIFPSNVKSQASTITVCCFWGLAFIISKSFISISEALGTAAVFWLFAGNCFIATIFVSQYVIETKGKNFQEIQDLLSK